MLNDCLCTDLSIHFAKNASTIEVHGNGFFLLWQHIPYKGLFFHLSLLLFNFCILYFISYITEILKVVSKLIIKVINKVTTFFLYIIYYIICFALNLSYNIFK